jgi:hypothetical protein
LWGSDAAPRVLPAPRWSNARQAAGNSSLPWGFIRSSRNCRQRSRFAAEDIWRGGALFHLLRPRVPDTGSR